MQMILPSLLIKVKIHKLFRNISTSKYFFSEELNVHRDTKDNNANTPFEFSEANLKRLSAIIQNYPEGFQRSAISAAMDIVQRQIGWVPISAMHKVAEVLSIPRMRVYEWATFYSMIKRRYRGKYNVKVCVTTPCMLRGADTILQVVEETTLCCTGGVSADGMFGVDIVQCQGACVNAPVIVVDDDYYEDVNECDVHNIIQTLRCGRIPPWGPQSDRFASEPITGKTTLIEEPPPPGFGLQPSLFSPV
ncbi:probable NADH dehydrogenase [ubiquinone] flavoprotein 2, mitochondrial [Vanessa atalanta]|uniref:probable NADH dehydrogenase [ubiquinone] flavoprotein 2, mitochondrial n=1 Tax=Vanessa atalanta TaxID=42275 RepID=UPI001FCE0B50|nr:probable NADH dehydrogenase [ubiquinone] flavoprotein 2, mitochondrial [Vanessa atalanta]